MISSLLLLSGRRRLNLFSFIALPLSPPPLVVVVLIKDVFFSKRKNNDDCVFIPNEEEEEGCILYQQHCFCVSLLFVLFLLNKRISLLSL